MPAVGAVHIDEPHELDFAERDDGEPHVVAVGADGVLGFGPGAGVGRAPGKAEVVAHALRFVVGIEAGDGIHIAGFDGAKEDEHALPEPGHQRPPAGEAAMAASPASAGMRPVW